MSYFICHFLNMEITKNFTLEEFTNSTTASRKGIVNKPNADELKNIKNLALLLQKIRDKYGKSIIISSGFRCPKLNSVVGGVSNSDHVYGAAADIHTISNTKADNKILFNLIVDMLKWGHIEVRQLINEHNYSWIHISTNHPKAKIKKNQILNI